MTTIPKGMRVDVDALQSPIEVAHDILSADSRSHKRTARGGSAGDGRRTELEEETEQGMKSRTWMGTLCLAIGLWVVGIALAGTSEVFRVRGTIKGVIQFGNTNDNFTQKVKITRDDLINLALGRDQGTRVPANEELALGSRCDINLMKMFVYDTSAESNLATISFLNPVHTVFTDKKREMISEFLVPGAGNSSNGLAGGTLLMYVNFDVNKNDNCLKKWTGNMLGVLDVLLPGTNLTLVVSTNIVGNTTNTVTNVVAVATGVDFPVVIPTVTYKTQGKKIGTLIEPGP